MKLLIFIVVYVLYSVLDITVYQNGKNYQHFGGERPIFKEAASSSDTRAIFNIMTR
jgi:hypothetical protein